MNRYLCAWCWSWARRLDSSGVCSACQMVRGRRP